MVNLWGGGGVRIEQKEQKEQLVQSDRGIIVQLQKLPNKDHGAYAADGCCERTTHPECGA